MDAKTIDHPDSALLSIRILPHRPSGQTGDCARLSCHWPVPLSPGTRVELRVACETAQALALAEVADCRPEDGRYRITLCICDRQQAWQLRMVEQLCHIRSYRQSALREGRRLAPEEAAAEWISRFADAFPALAGEH